MNKQWTIIFALIFTLIVAIFAVINVRSVEVDYLFGRSEWPLILVILGLSFNGSADRIFCRHFSGNEIEAGNKNLAERK